MIFPGNPWHFSHPWAPWSGPRFEPRSWQLRLAELRQIGRVLRELIPPYLLQAARQAVP